VWWLLPRPRRWPATSAVGPLSTAVAEFPLAAAAKSTLRVRPASDVYAVVVAAASASSEVAVHSSF